VLEHVPGPVTDDRQRDIAEATQALHTVFERWIREAPEQWMWTHRKWARARSPILTIGEASFPAPLPDPVDPDTERDETPHPTSRVSTPPG
jgi:hypothetical protein